MTTTVSIKEIARMAGVSAGTVDRVIHNRGNVSPKSREAVESVLAMIDQKHAQHLLPSRVYKIIVSIPTPVAGEYWGSIYDGIERAVKELQEVSISLKYFFFNQFDIYSCRSSYEIIEQSDPDGVIIGSSFREETLELCATLEARGIPYAFVDSYLEGTSPVASFATNQFACGRILGRIMYGLSPEKGRFAVFSAMSIGNVISYNSEERLVGLKAFFKDLGQESRVLTTTFSVLDPAENERTIPEFLRKNQDIKGIAVMNSRANIIADIVHSVDPGISILSFDVTAKNVRCLEKGTITCLLCQRPEQQGFNAVRALVNKFLYNRVEPVFQYFTPVDIIIKENYPFYKDLFV